MTDGAHLVVDLTNHPRGFLEGFLARVLKETTAGFIRFLWKPLTQLAYTKSFRNHQLVVLYSCVLFEVHKYLNLLYLWDYEKLLWGLPWSYSEIAQHGFSSQSHGWETDARPRWRIAGIAGPYIRRLNGNMEHWRDVRKTIFKGKNMERVIQIASQKVEQKLSTKRGGSRPTYSTSYPTRAIHRVVTSAAAALSKRHRQVAPCHSAAGMGRFKECNHRIFTEH